MLIVAGLLGMLVGAATSGEPPPPKITQFVLKARGKTAIEVLRLDAPVLYAGGDNPRLGLAQDYPHDEGLAAHRDVLFATGFSGTSWREKYFTEGEVVDPTFAEDPVLRATYLREQFVKGEVGSCALDYRFRFRHHPAIKIDEVWLNWYHGGTQPASAAHHFRMTNVVVARAYIGPVARWDDDSRSARSVGRAALPLPGLRARPLPKVRGDPWKQIRSGNTRHFHQPRAGVRGETAEGEVVA
jgi:hypothetical protein